MEASSKKRESYAWQSILKVRDVIQNGALWRVGDGKKKKIWNQRWLLEDHHRSIITHEPPFLLDCTVDQLIMHARKKLDHGFIDRLFIPYDAEVIKSIPLSDQSHADKLIWPGNANGQYSVKSGYQFLVNDELKNSLGSSSPDALHQVSITLWSLNIPIKCQLFAWHAVREALPTKLNLSKRQIPFDQSCENCKKYHEDGLHELWSCKHVQPTWDNETWLQPLRISPHTDFADLLSKVLLLDSHSNPEIFIIINWALLQR